MRRPTSPGQGGEIPTVLGTVRAQDLHRILPHEHIASVYGGWGRLADRPNPEWERAILEHYTPLLTRLASEFDCNAIIESTPGWGCRGARDFEVLAELSRRSGVHIIIATGRAGQAVPIASMLTPMGRSYQPAGQDREDSGHAAIPQCGNRQWKAESSRPAVS